MVTLTNVFLMRSRRGHHSFGHIAWLTTWALLSEFVRVQSGCQEKCSSDLSSEHIYQTFVNSHIDKSNDITCQLVKPDQHNYAMNFTFSCTRGSCTAAAYMTSESEIFSLDGKKHYDKFPSIAQLTSNCTNNHQSTNLSSAQEHNSSFRASTKFPQDDVLSLQINSNCITSFPWQYFCSLSNLAHLDLSCNALRDPSVLGCNASCNVSCCACNLTSLSLKNNHFKNIAGNTFGSFPRLRSLDLSDNSLESVQEEAFCNLTNLELLDMSKNNLATLPTVLFLPLQKLTSLALSDNRLNEARELNLSYLTTLSVLRLDRNLLKNLLPDVFKNLGHLQTLTLEFNSISELQDDFQFLNCLVTLDLSSNGLQTMPEPVFYPLTNLSTLNLSKNPHIQIPFKAFVKSKSLSQLLLSECKLKQFPNVANLSQLAILDLSANDISVLNKNDLANLYMLTTLNLKGNSIEHIASGTFDGVARLKVVMLEYNKICNLANIYQNSKIQKLTLNYNMVSNFSFDYISPELRILELRNNSIATIVKSNDTRNMSIQSLYLSGNNISCLEGFQIPPSIRLLDLANNRISSVSFVKYDKSQTDLFADNATLITLRNNALRSICSPLLLLMYNRVVPTFDFTGNPLMCACELMVKNTSSRFANPSSSSPASNECGPVVNSSSKDPTHLQNDIDLLTCDNVDKNAACQCNLLYEYSRMCSLPCPNQCFCYIDKWFSTYFINCRGRNLATIPAGQAALLQTNVTFSFNNISKISSADLEPFSNAIGVYLDHNLLETVSKDALQHLLNVRVLALDSNCITHLPSGLLDDLRHLQELRLRDNRLRALDPSAFLPLGSLQVLTLDHNLLSDFPVWELPPWKATFRLSLSENPWSCNCTLVEPFRNWLQKAVAIVSDADHLYCGPSLNGSGTNNSFIFFNSSICYNAGVHILTLTNITLLVTSLAALLVLGILVVLIFVYRREMQVVLYSKYGIRLFAAKMDNDDRVYDAFLSYSNEDAEFVHNELIPKLEQIEKPYRICIHDRDFLAGNFISDNIQQAVHNSCRTIVLLTDSFVVSDWCNFEFKTAHNMMLTDKCNRVIVIVLGKLTLEMEPDIKLYLNTKTYLTWGEQLFWEKLYFALPDRAAVN